MLPKHLRGFAFKRLKTRATIVVLLVAMLMFFGYYQSTSKEQENKEKQSLTQLQGKLKEFQDKIIKSESALKLWNEKVKKQHSERTGLRIQEAKAILDELKEANNINNLLVNLSNPELRQDFQDAKSTALVYSDVNLSFNAFSDIDAIKFINDALYKMPGHSQIKSFTMVAVPKVDDTLLANIASGKFVEVVDVKVGMLWQDMIDKSNILQPGKNGAKPRPQALQGIDLPRTKPVPNLQSNVRPLSFKSLVAPADVGQLRQYFGDTQLVSEKRIHFHPSLQSIARSSTNDLDIPYEDNDNSYVMVKRPIDSDADFNIMEKVNLKTLSILPCTEVTLDFNRCYQSICYESMPFGKVYRKVRGKDNNGKCEYIERTPKIGGRDCTFRQAESSEFEHNLKKYYSLALGQPNTDAKESIEKLVDFFENKCQVVTDSMLSSIVTIGTPIGVAQQDPELEITDHNISAAGQVGLSQPPTSVSKTKESTSNTESNTTLANSSAMFTKEEVGKINAVLKGYDKEKQEALGILDSGGVGFYLNSIIFYNKDKWTVWVNGKKYINESASSSDLTVTSVSPESVQIIWKTQDLDSQATNWRRRLFSSKENFYYSEDNKIQVEILGDNKSLIKFVLKPNQSININTMSIIEGNRS